MGDMADLISGDSFDDDYYYESVGSFRSPSWPRCSCGKVIPPGRKKCGKCVVFESMEPEEVEIKIKVSVG